MCQTQTFRFSIVCTEERGIGEYVDEILPVNKPNAYLKFELKIPLYVFVYVMSRIRIDRYHNTQPE